MGTNYGFHRGLSKNTTGILNSQLETRDQASGLKTAFILSSSSKIVSQNSSSIPTGSSLSTRGSLEPYVSVGCLKCGAPDHVATNRNCPRPRKGAPVVYGTPVSTPITKKAVSRSSKKHTTDNHQLKAAKLGDSTKFWYYISDDDDSEGEKQGSSNSVKKIRFEKDEKYKGQSSTIFDKNYYGLENGAPGITHHHVDEVMQLEKSSKSFAFKEVINIKKQKVTGTGDDTDEFTRGITRNLAETSVTTHPSNLHGRVDPRVIPQIESEPKMIHDENCLGSIPSLPWKVSGSLTFSPTKQSAIHLNGDVKASRTPRQQKRVSKLVAIVDGKEAQNPVASPQKQLRKTAEAFYPTTPKDTGSRKNYGIKQSRCSTISTTHGLDSSPQFSRLTTLVPSPRYPATDSHHTTEGDTNRSPVDRKNSSAPEKKMDLGAFKYNYMGSRNHIQAPRVRYAPNRVQGWRECRSMGTGLE